MHYTFRLSLPYLSLFQVKRTTQSICVCLLNKFRKGQSQWLRGLRHMAARLLGIWVQSPPGECMFFSCECCVLCQVKAYATGRSFVQESLPSVSVSLCVITHNNNTLHLQRLNRKRLDQERENSEIINCLHKSSHEYDVTGAHQASKTTYKMTVLRSLPHQRRLRSHHEET